jgi:hypothetical protein
VPLSKKDEYVYLAYYKQIVIERKLFGGNHKSQSSGPTPKWCFEVDFGQNVL